MKTKPQRLAAVLFCALCAAAVSSAQAYYNTTLYSTNYYYTVTAPAAQSSRLLKMQALSKLERLNKEGKSGSAQKGSSVATGAKPATTSSKVVYPFTRDRAHSDKLRDAFLVDLGNYVVAAEMPGLRELFMQNDTIEVVAKMIQREGLDSGSMNGFLAFWYGQTWAVSNQQPLPRAQQYQAIANQLAADPKQADIWANMDNRARQEFFERIGYSLIVQRANYSAYLKQGKKDSMARIATATQQGMKNLGMDMQSLKLTENGLTSL